MTQLKLSQYLIVTEPFLDPYDGVEKRIVHSTRSGKTQCFQEGVWREVCDKHNDNDTHRFDHLVQIKFLVPNDENELACILEENRSASAQYDGLYLVVQPTAACQLGCGYCGQTHASAKLNVNYQQRFVALAREKLQSGRFSRLDVGWFGAEPLLGLSVIREMTPALKAVASEFNCTYRSKIVTNGLDLTLDLAAELANEHSVGYIEITLDGLASQHDLRRAFKNGKPSFQKIFENLVRVALSDDFNLQIGIRCNVDALNHHEVIPLLRLIAEAGIQDRIDQFYVAEVHAWGNDAEMNRVDSELFASWQIRWIAEMSRLGFKTNIIPGRTKILCMVMRPESVLIDAYGELFNCTEVSYVKAYEVERGVPNSGDLVLLNTDSPSATRQLNLYSIGHIASGEVDANKGNLNDFYDRVANLEYPCYSCRMLPTCGGSCPKNWLEGHVPCPPEKFNIKQRLILDHFIKNGHRVASFA